MLIDKSNKTQGNRNFKLAIPATIMFPSMGGNGPPTNAFTTKGHGFGSGVRKLAAAVISEKESKHDASLCKVRVEFNIFDLPNISGGRRNFIDFLYLDEQYDVVYLQDAIRSKLRSIDCEGVDFEILSSGFVVDDAYFQDILGKALASKKRIGNQSGGGGGLTGLTVLTSSSANALGSQPPQLGSNGEVENWVFEVYVKKKRLTLESLSHLGGGSSGELKAARADNNVPPTAVPRLAKPSPQQLTNLNLHLSDRSAVPLVTVSTLAVTLQRGTWRIQTRVRTVKRKTDSIAECELSDIYVQHHVVTLVTFKRECMDKLLNLKPNACVQLFNTQCVFKNEFDKRFSANSHPLKLVFDESSECTVIDDPIISAEGPVQAIGIQSFRHPNPMPTGLATLGGVGSSTASIGWQGVQANNRELDASSTIGGSSMAATARTMTVAASSLVTASSVGASTANPQGTAKRTLLFQSVGAAKPSTQTPQSPLSPSIPNKPIVDARDDYLTFRTETEDFEAGRMKKKLRHEVSDKCFICELNLDDEDDIATLINRLKSFRKPVPIPSKDTIKALMTDRRTLIPEFEEDRIYCKTTYVNTVTNRLHRVHCRCAHLCTEYQLGRAKLAEVVSMAFMNSCSLCGEPGACTACGNPECDELYHSTCAIFSNGYVNFDIRDPYLPRPACPRHTNPNPSTNRSIRLSWIPSSGTEAFDSACVDRYDLRDPDDD